MTTKSIQRDPILEALFTSVARVEVLKLLFLRSSERHYVREIASLTDQPVRAVQRELGRLEQAGLLLSEADGNRKYFQVNRDSPVFSELRSLLVKTAGLADAFRGWLEPHKQEIEIAFIFGSYARGEESAHSDLDILAIGTISSKEMARVLSRLKEQLDREINPIVMHPTEFLDRVEGGDSFVDSIIQEPKIFLIGGEDELKALAG